MGRMSLVSTQRPSKGGYVNPLWGPGGGTYDVAFDVVPGSSYRASIKVLNPDGRYSPAILVYRSCCVRCSRPGLPADRPVLRLLGRLEENFSILDSCNERLVTLLGEPVFDRRISPARPGLGYSGRASARFS